MSASHRDAEAADAAERALRELLDDAEARRDPYARYRVLRELDPVHWSPSAGMWVVTRFDHAGEVLRDPRLGKATDDLPASLTPEAHRRVPSILRRSSLVYLNPPEHTRLRSLLSSAFTPARVEALRPRITRRVDELLDEALDGGELDVLDRLAFDLPVWVIGELVGVPVADRARQRSLVRAQALALEPNASTDELAAASRAAREMASGFNALVRERRAAPRDDLLSALLEARTPDGDRLQKNEVVAAPQLLFGAGFETTMNLVANGLDTLSRHPDAWRAMRDSPDLVAPTVEECLRYESPIQVDARTALEPADVAGQPVEAGTWVVAVLGAANRDPSSFPEPDRFAPDERHRGPRSLAFSAGIHHCLGAPLARLEATVLFERLAARVREVEPTGPPRWRPHLTSRGLEECRLRLVPA